MEHEDRMRRLSTLAGNAGEAGPEYYPYEVPATQHHLTDYPVALPVLRVVFRERAFFDTGQAVLTVDAQRVLNVIAASLRLEPPDVTVFVAGHADARGSADYNLELGLRRARAVAEELARIGVSRAQIFQVSFGEAVPIASNDTEEGMARNRRVEFLFAARPEPIAAWLAQQTSITCGGGDHGAPDDCPKNLRFRAESVALEEAPPTSVEVASPARVEVAPPSKVHVRSDVAPRRMTAGAPAKVMEVGRKIVEIDLREKIFTMWAPQ